MEGALFALRGRSAGFVWVGLLLSGGAFQLPCDLLVCARLWDGLGLRGKLMRGGGVCGRPVGCVCRALVVGRIPEGLRGVFGLATVVRR